MNSTNTITTLETPMRPLERCGRLGREWRNTMWTIVSAKPIEDSRELILIECEHTRNGELRHHYLTVSACGHTPSAVTGLTAEPDTEAPDRIHTRPAARRWFADID